MNKETSPKRSLIKQWIDWLMHGKKTDTQIDNEMNIDFIVRGLRDGSIKKERYFFPTLAILGGGYRTRYIFKSNYSESEWNKKPKHKW